jgi:Cytochrome c oxidase subunit III
MASFGGFMLTSGLVLYMHKFIGGWKLLETGVLVILYVMYTWWRDGVRNEWDSGIKFRVSVWECVEVLLCKIGKWLKINQML